MRNLAFKTILALVSTVLFTNAVEAADDPIVRVGVLGLDNYQAVAFTQLFNNPQAEGALAGLRVTAAYRVPSSDPESESEKLADRWQKQMLGLYQNPKGKRGVSPPIQFVDSMDALLTQSDVIMIMSLDGQSHWKQASAVLRAGKPLYIGRPLADSRADAVKILDLAAETGTPCFSSSQHRFSPGFAGMRDHPEVGRVIGCDVYGGYTLAHAQADQFVTPLHSIETLYTIMGPGVATVSCKSTPVVESVTAVWKDGRIGTYRGIKSGKVKYSATVFGDVGVSTAGIYGHGVPVNGVAPTKDEYMGYKGIAIEMAKFFKGGPPPVAAAETLEIFAFLEAIQESRNHDGAAIQLAE